MNIKTAEFIKGISDYNEILADGIPQIALIGRSNVGKSSVINSLTNRKDLARSSPTPGKTRQINFYLLNKEFYLVDLPGYGFASGSKDERENIQKLIYWYLFNGEVNHKKVILIIDASIGLTQNDAEMLHSLKQYDKEIILVANKIDKIKKSGLKKQLQDIQNIVGKHKVIPYSAVKKIGITDLAEAILK